MPRLRPTDEEVAAFIVVANQYGLNPFTREIHAFADSQRGIVPIVGIDGWAHLVNDEPRFNGCEFEEVEGQDGKPLKTICTMYVKDREHPVRVTERFSECKRNTNPWNGMPFRMLRHKSFMQAARLAFSISGLYDEDEARDIIGTSSTDATPAAQSRTEALLGKVTGRPVSEGQKFEPTPEAAAQAQAEIVQEQSVITETPEPDVSGVVDAEPPEAEPAPSFTNYEGFRLAMVEAAQDASVSEGDLNRMIANAVLGKGMKGKEQKIEMEVLRRWYQDFIVGKGFFQRG